MSVVPESAQAPGLRLVHPDPAFEASYRDYLRELGDETRYPFPLDFDSSDFPALLRRVAGLAEGIGVPDHLASSTTYWLVDGPELVGVSNLRHFLTGHLRRWGGHIGLGIRPSRRGMGLGRRLLALTLAEARARGIDEVHVHCLKGNLASARTILANGGVLDSEEKLEGAEGVVQRFRIAVMRDNAPCATDRR